MRQLRNGSAADVAHDVGVNDSPILYISRTGGQGEIDVKNQTCRLEALDERAEFAGREDGKINTF
jgi:hypothetical protein